MNSTATDLAGKAAEPFLQQGTLGATVVILALAYVMTVVFMWRENKAERKAHDLEIAAKDKAIFDLQEAWRADTRTSLTSVTTALDTLRIISATVTATATRERS